MRFVFITLIIISGCLPINKKLISPSELLYYTANTFFEDENYPQAIEKYKLFLEKYPASSLTASAKLNLGMFYYYQGNFKEAADILMAVDLKDENLKKFLDTVIKTCEEKIEETFVFMEVKEKETIPMEVLDAYANGAGDITLKGKISKTADVFADNAKGEVNENNEFIVSLSWKKGKSIKLFAKDKNGNEGTMEYFPDTEPPNPPSNLRIINVTANSVELEWDIPTGRKAYSEMEIKGYKLYYQLKGDGLKEVPDIITNTKYEIVGLENFIRGTNKTFKFYLRAIDRMYNYSEPSDELEVTLP